MSDAHPWIIAIDGPAGAGKSSVAKQLALALGWTFLDTGATYRAVTLAWLEAGRLDTLLEDPQWLKPLTIDMDGLTIRMNGNDVTAAIRTPQVTALVSKVSAAPLVRNHLTSMQRAIAARRPCILEGRDIGTVVFPNAMLKVFLTATPKERARRRWLQMGGEHCGHALSDIIADQQRRDDLDSSRAAAPLKQAEDAWYFESDNLSQEEVVSAIAAVAKVRMQEIST